MAESGVAIEGEVRAMAVVRAAGGDRLLAIAHNDGKLQILRPRHMRLNSSAGKRP
jgi:hypothetical protein